MAQAVTVAGLSPCRSWLNPRPVNVVFVVDKLALEQDFLPVSVIPPMLHIYSLICHGRYIILATDSVIQGHN